MAAGQASKESGFADGGTIGIAGAILGDIGGTGTRGISEQDTRLL